MENPIYERLQGKATDLITRYGRSMALVRVGESVIDPVTDEEVRGPDLVLPVTGVLTEYRDNVIDGTRIQQGDRRVVLTAERKPSIADRLLIAERVVAEWEWEDYWLNIDSQNELPWLVVDVEEKQPATTTIVYILQVRR